MVKKLFLYNARQETLPDGTLAVVIRSTNLPIALAAFLMVLPIIVRLVAWDYHLITPLSFADGLAFQLLFLVVPGLLVVAAHEMLHYAGFRLMGVPADKLELRIFGFSRKAVKPSLTENCVVCYQEVNFEQFLGALLAPLWVIVPCALGFEAAESVLLRQVLLFVAVFGWLALLKDFCWAVQALLLGRQARFLDTGHGLVVKL